MKLRPKDKVWRVADFVFRDGLECHIIPDVSVGIWLVVPADSDYSYIRKTRGGFIPAFFVTELAFGDPHAFLPNAQDDRVLSCHAEEALSRREHLGTLVPFLLVLTEPAFGDPYALLQNAQNDGLMCSEKDFYTKKGT